jgi:hypothetical protein
MKQLNVLRKTAITTLLSFSSLIILGVQNAQAMSTYGLACPEKYIATVTNVEDVQATTAVPKVEVDFQIIQTLKGESITTKKLQVAKGGPVEFKSGQIYTLEANDSWLCSATVFSKI